MPILAGNDRRVRNSRVGSAFAVRAMNLMRKFNAPVQ